jgi:membrane protein YdbS with pleckstrin-like domain
LTAFQPLAPRARLLFHVQALVRLALGWLPLALIGGGILATQTSITAGVLAASGVLSLASLMALWWPSLSFDRYGWALGDDDVRVASGVLFRRIVTIPMSRVQHVDVHQGPIEQLFGLSSVRIHTASGVGVDGIIPGLEAEDAEKLRDTLVARTAGDDDGV